MVWPALLGVRSADCRVFLPHFSSSCWLSSFCVLHLDSRRFGGTRCCYLHFL